MYPLDYAIICEVGHFVIGASVGYSAYSLTYHTRRGPGVSGTRLFWSSALVGLSSALLSHVLLDMWGAV